MISAIVKGSASQARGAATLLGIEFNVRAQVGRLRLETCGTIPDKYLAQVQRWFGRNDPLIASYGYPVGSLLVYSQHEPVAS